MLFWRQGQDRLKRTKAAWETITISQVWVDTHSLIMMKAVGMEKRTWVRVYKGERMDKQSNCPNVGRKEENELEMVLKLDDRHKDFTG